MEKRYCSFDGYMVVYDPDEVAFQMSVNGQVFAEHISIWTEGKKMDFSDAEHKCNVTSNEMTLPFARGFEGEKLVCSVDHRGISIKFPTPLELRGDLCCSPTSIAMSTGSHDFLRAGYGKAVTGLDDMLFDVETDTALIIDGAKGKCFRFDRENACYKLEAGAEGEIRFSVKEKVYETTYGISYAPINKKATFQKAPVGWMTWYAVKFHASEETVLENTRWMAEHLKKYGADAVWVDWEWYHKDFKGVRDDGVDTFHPDPEKYPNGLKYLSDEIKKLGFVPNLWVGFTTDPGENEFVKEHPEIVLLQKPEWCGQYFFDMSHPKFLDEFLPKALSQVKEWGYEAVKFDALPMTLGKHEEFHGKMYDPKMTTKDAYRGMIKKTREVLGNDRYLLSCCGVNDSDVLWACDLFDAARVGGDIFNWKEFLEQGIGRTARYYPFHNIVFYNDPDNVVIREEFNTIEQAKSRAAFVSMLGLPFTFGDDLTKLPEERVEILRRSIPVLDIHPMDLRRMTPGEALVIHLAIDTGWEGYDVVSVLNTTDAEREETIDFAELGMEKGKKLVFEYFASELSKVSEGVLQTVLKPYETKVFAVRSDKEIPQIVSTSRHLYQGALELGDILWDEKEKTLTFCADLVEDDLYTVSIFVPEAYDFRKQKGFESAVTDSNLLKLSVRSETGERRRLSVSFDDSLRNL